MSEETTILYRPVGPRELELLEANGCVGAAHHMEWWIPAEVIEVIAAFP